MSFNKKMILLIPSVILLIFITFLSIYLYMYQTFVNVDKMNKVINKFNKGDNVNLVVNEVKSYGFGCSFDDTWGGYYCSLHNPNPYLPHNFLAIIIEIHLDTFGNYSHSNIRNSYLIV